MKADVVVATFNGERYVREQLASIQQCDGYEDIIERLIVVDDGSVDQTESIVEALANLDPKIEWHRKHLQLGGCPAKNFERGLHLSTAPWVFLADQDDVWVPSKLQAFQKAIQGLNTTMPTAVFSDVEVVDETLRPMSNSYFALKNIPKDWHLRFDNLLQQNVVSGCAMVVNRSLLNLALPLPAGAYMHDWWLALVAKGQGVLHFIDQPLVMYRQHQANTIGAKPRNIGTLVRNFSVAFDGFKRSVLSVCDQAAAYRQAFESTESETLRALAQFKDSSKLERLTGIISGKMTRSTKLARSGLIFVALSTSQSRVADAQSSTK